MKTILDLARDPNTSADTLANLVGGYEVWVKLVVASNPQHFSGYPLHPGR